MMHLCFQEKIAPFVIEKEDRALYMSYLREQNVDIIFEKVKELQKFEKKRMDKFKKKFINKKTERKSGG